MTRNWIILAAAALVALPVRAQIEDTSLLVTADCYTGRVQPRGDGTTAIEAIVQITVAPRWHVYWMNPGITGLPTELTWKLPAGARVENVAWSLPHVSDDPLMYTYMEDAAIAYCRLVLPTAATKKTLSLLCTASFLVCREDCRKGEADCLLELEPAKLSAAKADMPVDPAFDKLAALVPRDPLPKDFSLQWNFSAAGRVVGALTLPAGRKVESVAFLPNPEGVEVGRPEVMRKGEREFQIAVPVNHGSPAPESWRGVLVFSGGDFPTNVPPSRRAWIVSHAPN